MNPYYRDFSDFTSKVFPDVTKLQKLTVDVGCTCPNRDGTIGRNGCIYCNNASFSPIISENEWAAFRSLSSSAELLSSINKSKSFFARKYPDMKYLVYFQSYTNTYGDEDKLLDLYRFAAEVPGVEGIVIGTRPDCLSDSLLKGLKDAGIKAVIELGAESSHDKTLKEINRGHTWSQTVETVSRLHQFGFPVGLHFIFGLPGESREMMLETVRKINSLPVDIVKFHHLQVLKATELYRRYVQNENYVKLWELDDYISFCVEAVKALRKDISIERFVSSAPPALRVAPDWGLKNYEFTNLLYAALEKAGLKK